MLLDQLIERMASWLWHTLVKVTNWAARKENRTTGSPRKHSLSWMYVPYLMK